jgi:site-specific DNA recombinase
MNDVRVFLSKAAITEHKAFLRSFVKGVTVDGNHVRIEYRLPLPSSIGRKRAESVLPIVTPGGDRGIRTPDLRDANAALSQLSYIPTLA